MTTTRREPFPFVTKVIDMFGDWLKQRRELNELMEYAAEFGELEPVARELNVTRRPREAGAARTAKRERVAIHTHRTGHRRRGPTACRAGLFARHGARLFVLHA